MSYMCFDVLHLHDNLFMKWIFPMNTEKRNQHHLPLANWISKSSNSTNKLYYICMYIPSLSRIKAFQWNSWLCSILIEEGRRARAFNSDSFHQPNRATTTESRINFSCNKMNVNNKPSNFDCQNIDSCSDIVHGANIVFGHSNQNSIECNEYNPFRFGIKSGCFANY